MSIAPDHQLYKGWQVYQDPAPLWEGSRWVGCSDRFETCVSGPTKADVLLDIDDIENDASAPWAPVEGDSL